MNEKKLPKEKTTTQKTKSNIVVILLILAIIASSIFGYYAYSKYTDTLTGNGTATVAKWSFKVNGATEQFATIELDKTMTAVNNIMPNRVAPGTKGVMSLALDTTDCEVAVDYTITIDVTQKPTNLKMYEKYENDTYSEEIVAENGKMTVTGIIPLEQIGTVQNKYIYWNWPYETGTEKNEIEKNDETDTIDSNKGSIVLPITVTAVQRNTSKPEGPTLAELVKVGDYVNYNAASGKGAGKSYTTDSSVTGYSNDTGTTFSSSDTMKWKVMSVNKTTGTVELMAENPTANTVALYGKTGYKNAETVLNDIGAVYGYGDGATGGRSITVEDVNKLENYTPTDDTTTSRTYTSGTFINEDGTEVTATTDNPVTKSYTTSTAEKSTNKYYSYTTTNFSGKTFWLGSRCILLNSRICNFGVRDVRSGGVYRYDLFDSYGNERVDGRAALPVVSLKSNIQTSGKDESGAWNLVIE